MSFDFEFFRHGGTSPSIDRITIRHTLNKSKEKVTHKSDFDRKINPQLSRQMPIGAEPNLYLNKHTLSCMHRRT